MNERANGLVLSIIRLTVSWIQGGGGGSAGGVVLLQAVDGQFQQIGLLQLRVARGGFLARARIARPRIVRVRVMRIPFAERL